MPCDECRELNTHAFRSADDLIHAVRLAAEEVDRGVLRRVGVDTPGQAEQEALASVLGGVQSMFTAAWDEPFALPTEESTTLALRTQQVLAYETGVAKVADPLGGSYYVEALTDAMEAKVIEIMDDLERRGGMVKAVEEGYLHRLISEEAFRVQTAIASGERTVVGVNRFETDEDPPEVEGYEMDEKGRIRQLERLAEVKR